MIANLDLFNTVALLLYNTLGLLFSGVWLATGLLVCCYQVSNFRYLRFYISVFIKLRVIRFQTSLKTETDFATEIPEI